MPFRSGQFVGTYNPKELRALQSAYLETCILLGVSAPTEAEALRVAKKVYNVYDSGIEDAHEIARIIQHAESID